MATRWTILAFLLISQSIQRALAFQSYNTPKTDRCASLYTYPNSLADTPAASFRDRMLKQLNEESKKNTPNVRKNALVEEVRTINEYKRTVMEEADGSFVAVWFYAPWCRACRATSPGFASLAKHHPETKFVKVPVVEENASLHQGLGVPSVPYLHLYHPDLGLVEEQKLARKHLPGFHKMLQDYVEGSCSLERMGEWSTETPYNPAPKSV